MRKNVWIIGICIVCLLCGGYLLMNNNKANQYAEDMQYFFDCVEENNLILEKIPSDEEKQKWIEKSLECESDKEFYQTLVNSLDLYGEGGHLSIISPGFYTALEYDYETIPEIRERFSILNDQKVKDAYEGLMEELGIDKAELMNQYKEQSTGEQSNDFEIHEEDNMLVIKIPSFEARFIEPQIEEIKQKLSTFTGNTLVIDIRENGGVSDTYWMDLVSLTSFKDYTDSKTISGRGKLSKEYVESNEGKVTMQDDGKGFTYTRNNSIKSKHFRDFEKVYILTSDKVFSASESFVQFAKEQGYATLVGDTTGGAGGGIDPLMIELPNTHFLIRLESAAHLPYNTEPDVVCKGYTLDEYIRTIKVYEQTK